MCQVLNVNRSGYYAWSSNPDSARALDNAVLLGEIKQFFAASGNVYGSPRIYRDCKAAGLACSENRVAKLMHQAKVHAVRGYRRARYKAGKPAIAAPNRLRQVFVATSPDEAWVTDITFAARSLACSAAEAGTRVANRSSPYRRGHRRRSTRSEFCWQATHKRALKVEVRHWK